jgi:hypothetical protein
VTPERAGHHKPETADALPASKAQRQHATALGAVGLVSIVVGVLVGRYPPYPVSLFLGAVVVGGFVRAIVPNQIGITQSAGKRYWVMLCRRAGSAAGLTAAWAGVATTFGVFVGAGLAWVRRAGDLIGAGGEGGVWGVLVGGTAGVLFWTSRQIDKDRALLTSSVQFRNSFGRKPQA